MAAMICRHPVFHGEARKRLRVKEMQAEMIATHGREVNASMGWWERLGYLLGFRLSPYNRAFARRYLDDAGWFLFSQMSIMDQRHTLRVARYIARKAVLQMGIANLHELIQAALLHDAGKIKGEILWIYRPSSAWYGPLPLA